jgi:hypothetical protein
MTTAPLTGPARTDPDTVDVVETNRPLLDPPPPPQPKMVSERHSIVMITTDFDRGDFILISFGFVE